MTGWTDEQRTTIYRANLTGTRPETIADQLGVPTPLITEHLRRTKPDTQLDHLLEDARRTATTGQPHTLNGLDPKTLTIPDLVATAEKHGSGRTRQTAFRLRNSVERLKGLVAWDQDQAVRNAQIAELQLDLGISRKRTKSIEDKIRRLKQPAPDVSGSAVDRRATGGRGNRQGPAGPETQPK